MAKLVNKVGTSKYQWVLPNNAEVGTFPGTIVDVLENEDVEREYQGEKKTIDVCRFLIAYKNDEDDIILVQTYEMTISGSPKSKLVKFVSNLRGKQPPLDGSYDFCEEVGKMCMVTIGEKVSKSTKQPYQYVENVAPVTKKLKGDCPDPDEVKIPGGKKYGRDEEKDELPPAKPSAKDDDDDNEEDPF